MRSPSLADRIVVVTGASSGIGRAAALTMASRGATLVVTARDAGALDDVVAGCERAGGRATAVPADVTAPGELETVAAEAVGRYGRIDAWVNNAGVNLFARVEEAPPEQWRRVVETNLFGCFHGARAALPHFREQGSGVLVNVASVLSRVGSPYQSPYVASKFAVRALSDCIRQELQDAPGISVCTVLPGPVDTPLFRHAGNHMRRTVVPPPPVTHPDRVADAIASCVLRPRDEVVVGAATKLTTVSARLAPKLTERMAARQISRQHFGDQAAEPTSGNLFEPGAPSASSTDGWRGQRSRRSGGGLKLVVGVGAGVAAAVATARARR